MSAQAYYVDVKVPIILLGSLVRHVVLTPEKERGHYTAHVREINEPLIEAMINEALTEDSPRKKNKQNHTPTPRPAAKFVLDYKDKALSSVKEFGELHSVLDYFPRGATKKLQNEQRLRVRHEYVSDKIRGSGDTAESADDDSFLDDWFFKERGPGAKSGKEKSDGPEGNASSADDSEDNRQIMVVYDHDSRFRGLLSRVQQDEKKKKKFRTISKACKGGVILAINDHETNREQLTAKSADGSALTWFRDAVDLCFHEELRSKTVVIVAADALRKCGERIMERGAVESSVNDVLMLIQSTGFHLEEFCKKCSHLVIVFRETGALHIDFDEKHGFVTYGPNCDRHAQMHPGAYGRAPGRFATMVISVVRELCWAAVNAGGKLDVDGAICMAIAAYSYHYDAGFLLNAPKGSPFDDYANILSAGRRAELFEAFQKGKEEYLLASVEFKLEQQNPPKWNRVNEFKQDEFVSKLIEIVQKGIEAPLRKSWTPAWAPNFKPKSAIRVPFSQYGLLTLVDPVEIERFSSLAKLIDKYLWTPSWTKPLSIAVFGAPGAGKSFAVKQIIQRVSPDRKTEPLIFNLAQFASTDQLTEAFHKVQDSALKAQEVPLVVFDEFDSDLNRAPLGWLKYFLAPMQDGEFRGKDADYRVGRAIFLFAGGTSQRFDDFKMSLGGHGESHDAEAEDRSHESLPSDRAKQAKLPDFISRLRGHLDVAGINPPKGGSLKSTEDNRMILMRRAILLRSALVQHAGEIFRKVDSKVSFANINEDLILAFLYAHNYVHGSRSMEAIVQMSRFIDGHFVPTSLPTRELLETHVDFPSFMSRIRGWHYDQDFI
jgi:hypothetical protein